MRRHLLYYFVRWLVSVLAVLLACACSIALQTRRAAPATPSPTPTLQSETAASDTINRPTSKPYMGELSIFEDPKRDGKLQPNRIMDLLGIREGSTVADIGAGSGWFSVRAARRVGNSGLVYAEDINSEYLKYIDNRAKRENLPNIRTVLGKEDDPLLPAKTVDAVLLLKTYHEVAQPIRLLKRTREAMRLGALLGIIDRNGKGDDHGIDKQIVIEEAGRAGFVLVNQYDFVKPDGVDYFLVFRASP